MTVIDMGEGGVQTLEQVIGCAIAEALTVGRRGAAGRAGVRWG